MRKFRAIVQSITEPEDKELLWIKEGTMHYYHAGKWEPINAEQITQVLNNLLVEIEYKDLVSLRDSGSLIPELKYRITDYVCTTTTEGTAVAEYYMNRFDIIVTALNKNTLSEEASIIASKMNDSSQAKRYFPAFKIKYSLDNDKDRFNWADSSNGRGVIYYMRDHQGNECPYDFKHIVFQRLSGQGGFGEQLISEIPDEDLQEGRLFPHNFPIRDFESAGANIYSRLIEEPLYFYTFHQGEGLSVDQLSDVKSDNDASWEIKVYNNSIGVYRKRYYQALNNIVFRTIGESGEWYDNTFYGDCYNITMPTIAIGNTFGSGSSNIVIGSVLRRCTFGKSSRAIIILGQANSCTFGDSSYLHLYTEISNYTVGSTVNSIFQAVNDDHEWRALADVRVGNSVTDVKFLGDVESCSIGNNVSRVQFLVSAEQATIGDGVVDARLDSVQNIQIEGGGSIVLSEVTSAAISNSSPLEVSTSSSICISECSDGTLDSCSQITIQNAINVSLSDTSDCFIGQSSDISLDNASNCSIRCSTDTSLTGGRDFKNIAITNCNGAYLDNKLSEGVVQNIIIPMWNGDVYGNTLPIKDEHLDCPHCLIVLSDTEVVPLGHISHT